MSKPEHVQLARQGTLAISRWREQHPGEQLDFSGANLSNYNLNRADLSGADFSGADLIGIHLNQANLQKANLREAVPLIAYLSGADLREADLSDATIRRSDLSGANLAGANLTGANLSGANLSGANLEKAGLARASLGEANLSGVNFSRADLSRADFSNADLTRANLSGANLVRAILYKTLLNGTILKEAAMFHTVFGDCDLSKAVDLDQANHQGPSIVGVDTIFRSAGRIPEKFLRGTGVPEDLVINYQRTVAGLHGQFYTCFISYCAKDQGFAQRLQADLQARGVRCWHFPADVIGGRWVNVETTLDTLGMWITDDVDRGIQYYDKLVVVCSGDSLATERLREEMTHGIQKQDQTGRWIFFPIAISDAAYDPRNRYVRGLQLWRHLMFDFRGWEDSQVYSSALEGLLDNLNRDQEASVGMAPVEEEKG